MRMPTQQEIDMAHEHVGKMMDDMVTAKGVPFVVMTATLCAAAAGAICTIEKVFGKDASELFVAMFNDKMKVGRAFSEAMNEKEYKA